MLGTAMPSSRPLVASSERWASRNGSVLHPLMAVFSSKVLGGGPRLLVYLAAFLASFMLAVRILPSSDSGFSLGRALWHWPPSRIQDDTGTAVPETQDDVMDDSPIANGKEGGGLRIVVFGEDDIATPQGHAKGRYPSWTEGLCREVSDPRNVYLLSAVFDCVG